MNEIQVMKCIPYEGDMTCLRQYSALTLAMGLDANKELVSRVPILLAL